MNEWRQTIVLICTVVVAFVALATFMQFEHAAIRADMRAEHADMRAEHAAMRNEMRAEHAEIREQLSSVDRRTARIEGHLFGIEVSQDPVDGE